MSAPAAARPPRSRLYRWSRRALWLAFAAGALLGAVLAWLLLTGSGRDTLLGQVTGLLPPGALTWERAEGSVRGPLVLHDAVYVQDGVELRVKRLMLDPDLLPVLGRRLQLDALELEGAVLTLPAPADEPFELPEWPEVLPRLPLPLDIRSARVDVRGLQVFQGELRRVDIRTLEARGLHLVDEGFALTELRVDSDLGRASLKGEYRPARDFRSALTGTFARDATDEAPAAALQFSLQGKLDALALDVRGDAPQPLLLQATLADGKGDSPEWKISARSDGLAPALLGIAPGEPLRFALQLEGVGATATLSGEGGQGETNFTIEPSEVSLSGDVLRVDPLDLVLDNGRVRVVGDAKLDATNSFDLRISSDGLRFEPAAGEPGALPVQARGELVARGIADDWTLEGEAVLARNGEEARLRVAGEGDREQLRLDALRASTPGGALEGSGRVRWSPRFELGLQVALQELDPGYFLPDYPGRLSGALDLQAVNDDAGWQGAFTLEDLRGELRQRTVAGRANATWQAGQGQGEATLRLGESAVLARGAFGQRYDLQVQLEPLQLADVLAGGEGRVEGRFTLQGPAAAPDVSADLRGSALAWGDYRAETLTLSGQLPARGDGGDFTIEGTGVAFGGPRADTLSLRARGSQAQLALEAQARSEHGELQLVGDIGREGTTWAGVLSALQFTPSVGPELTLEDEAVFRLGTGVLQLDRSCLRAGDTAGRLCVAATGERVTLDGNDLPLALAQPWLPTDEGVPLSLDGVVALRAALQRGRDGAWRGDGEATSPLGVLKLDPESEREVFRYETLRLGFTLAGEALQAELTATLADEGRVSARLDTGLADTAPLDGELQLDVRELTFLELLSQDLAAPTGRLQGRLQLAGTRAAPAISGEARLAAFAAELPGLGLKLAEGEFELSGQPDGVARLSGSVRSGEGRLRLDGSLNFANPEAPLQLVLGGEQVTFASTPELYLIASPTLALRFENGQLQVRGRVVVPEARVDLELLDSSASVSPDVVVLDPVDPEQGRALPLDLDFAVALGEDVRLKGFGLDGRMSGTLAMRQRPGRAATASGTLEVTGDYRAYGQALSIRRARLGYADSAVDNPTLDIRAERAFDDVTVGVQVRGSARRPETTVTSRPAMDTSEALSWLVFGRPLSTATGAESQQLDAAAMALGAGGNLVAQQVGARLGLDEAGISDSRNLGGAALTVGKYLSPRLFISYGVSLVGSGQVVTLKYLLARGFDVSVESGNENAASLNWRTER